MKQTDIDRFDHIPFRESLAGTLLALQAVVKATGSSEAVLEEIERVRAAALLEAPDRGGVSSVLDIFRAALAEAEG